MLSKFQQKTYEILFLIDASYSMTGLKIQNAILTINSIFNKHISLDDKVGYIFFNDSPHTIIHLTYKSSNEAQLKNYLSKIPE